MAIVLGSGRRGENVVDMARRLMDSLGGMAGLVRAEPKALQRTPGLGPAKAAQIAAALELGRRAGQVTPAHRPLLNSPEAVFALLGARLLSEKKERLFVLSLDTRGRLLGAPMPIAGGVTAVQARPAEVFRDPILQDAVSVVLVHNHPSGDPRPSPQDVTTTADLAAAGELLELKLVDHVIIGANTYLSMQREGYKFGK
jgi:DNA repair protein RadC